MEINGIFLINKSEGYTSRDVDNIVGKKFGTKKVGHAGTLDPFATGLMIVAINKGTKLLPFINDERKIYLATLMLGKATSTGDLTGEVIEEKPFKKLDNIKINQVLQSFLGESSQIPPIYSAIKVNGKELYKYAHEGKNIDIKPRNINIYSISLVSYIGNEIVFRCEVSKGTYIRTLGEDIAKKLETVGFLKSLCRESVGDYSLKDAIMLDKLSENDILNQNDIKLIYNKAIVDDNKKQDLINGKLIEIKMNCEYFTAIDSEGNLIAICKREAENIYYSIRGLF
jgi:tRNA pseudouridine55 synthase